MIPNKEYNNITYAVCLEAVKKGFDAIGGVQNAKYLTGFEWHRKVLENKILQHSQSKKSA